jgi:hypothetical protein
MRALMPFALVALLAGSAGAETQKIGILGLEVIGATDFESTTVARNLTGGLRSQVGKFPKYALAANSNKELIDEKVGNSCENEGAACMAKIGKKLGAQGLMYGHIEKKSQGGVHGYQLTLKMLDTESQLATPYTVWIPYADIGGSELDTWSTKAFANVTGNADGEPVGPAAPLRDRDPITPKPGKPGGGWRASAYVSGGVTVLLLGGLAFSANKVKTLNDACVLAPGSHDVFVEGPSDCSKGKTYSTMTKVTGFGAIAVGGFAILATYKGWFGSKHASEQNSGRSTRKKRTFVATPVVSPDGAGATVRFDW